MADASPEEKSALVDKIKAPGFRNTAMLILVPKGDGRACVFDELVGGTVPEGEWKMTLKSHPGKAIKRIEELRVRD